MEKKSIIFYIITVVLIAVSFFLSISAFGDDMFGFMGFIISFITIIVGIVLLIKKSIKNGKAYIVEMILIPVCLLVLFGAESYSNDFIAQREQLSIQEGDKIVYAIDKYFAETGKYPESLNELKPKYLEEIPRSHVFLKEDDFSYTYLKDRNVYLLYFKRPAQLRYLYSSDRKSWIKTD